MSKIIYIALMFFTLNVTANKGTETSSNYAEAENDKVTLHRDGQSRIHHFFKSKISDESMSIVYVINKDAYGGNPDVEIIVTTPSGQLIIQKDAHILLDGQHYDESNVQSIDSENRLMQFFNEEIFQEYIDLKLPNIHKNEGMYLDWFYGMVDRYENHSTKNPNINCGQLESIIFMAFAEHAHIRKTQGEAMANIYYRDIIEPLLAAFESSCILDN